MENQKQAASKQAPPISLRLKPVYETGLKNIAEREGVSLHAILVRAIEEWVQAYSRKEAADGAEYMRTSEEGKALADFADTALEDMLNLEERFGAAAKNVKA